MGKVWIEVSLISARGLRRSSLWKLQWFAVGWIDPKNKYCTRIDGSGNSNPVWKTKFATLIDSSGFQELALHVEVYSREPIFLRESLLGTAAVPLKEFLSKHSRKDRKAIEEVGSYQLRKGSSDKPLGFIDVSVCISEEGDVPSPYSGHGGIVLTDHDSNQMTFEKDDGSGQPQLHITRRARENRRTGESSSSVYNHDITVTDTNYPGPPTYQPPGGAARTPQPPVGSSYPPSRALQPPGGGSGYPLARTPPPPPPPAHLCFVRTFMPRTENLQGSYMNMPPSRGPGLGAGLGVGALAAGAVIFGDDFLSGFDVPERSRDPSLSVSLDPPL